MIGEGGRCDGAVKPDVAPCTGPCSCTGELMISSRVGIGKLKWFGNQFHTNDQECREEQIRGRVLTCLVSSSGPWPSPVGVPPRGKTELPR